MKRDDSATAAATGWANVRYMHALERLLLRFNAAQVPVMLLKGAALNAMLYDEPAQRPMRDLDLMVQPRRIEPALAVLESAGARRWRPFVRDDFFPRFYNEVEYRLEGLWPITLDVHVRPLRPLRCQCFVPDDALWRDARRISFGKATAIVPSPEHMLLHLAAHLAVDGARDGKGIRDIQLLLERWGRTLDWPRLLEHANEWRLGAALRRAFAIAENRLGVELLSPWQRREVRRLRANWRDRAVLRLAPIDDTRPSVHLLGSLLTCPSVRLRIGFALAVLIPGRQHMLDWYGREHRGWLVAAHAMRLAQPALRLLRRFTPWRVAIGTQRDEQGVRRLVAHRPITPGQTVAFGRFAVDADGWTKPPTYGPLRDLVLDGYPNVRLEGGRLIAIRQIRTGEGIVLAPRWPETAGEPPLHDSPEHASTYSLAA